MKFEAVPENSAAVRIIAGLLAAAKVGDVVAYRTMSEAVHLDIRRARYLLYRAIRQAEKSTGLTFGTVTGVGVKALDASGVAGEVGRVRTSIHKRAWKGIRKSERIDLTQLPQDQRTGTMIDICVLQAVRHASNGAATKRLTATVAQQQKVLDVGEVMKLME